MRWLPDKLSTGERQPSSICSTSSPYSIPSSQQSAYLHVRQIHSRLLRPFPRPTLESHHHHRTHTRSHCPSPQCAVEVASSPLHLCLTSGTLQFHTARHTINCGARLAPAQPYPLQHLAHSSISSDNTLEETVLTRGAQTLAQHFSALCCQPNQAPCSMQQPAASYSSHRH